MKTIVANFNMNHHFYISKKRNIPFVYRTVKKETSIYLIHSCLRNRTTLRFDFLHSFMVFARKGYKDSLVTNQQKCHFSTVSLHFFLPFGFVFIRMRSWESWNFRILCIKKQWFFAHIVLIRRQVQMYNSKVCGDVQWNIKR